MQKILIVEDEKLIRKGIVKMIERSKVEYSELLEANNGLTALEILKTNKVDLLLTDIKMPKMDGIELVTEVNKLADKPYIVTISGFDDFEYAVKMLRNGVKEYLLKPVERDKLAKLLKTIDEEIKTKQQELLTENSLIAQQLKYLLINDNISAREKAVIYEKFAKKFFKQYRVICGVSKSIKKTPNSILLDSVGIFDYLIFDNNELEEVLNQNFHKFLGISSLFVSITQLQKAANQALRARKRAFFYNINYCYFDQPFIKSEPLNHQYVFSEDLMIQAAKLIGVNKVDETLRIIKYLASDGKSGIISLETFETLIKSLLNHIIKSYQNIIDFDSEGLKKFQVIYDRMCLDDYIMEMNTWIIDLHSVINVQYDDYKNKKKIMDALAYIDQNYAKDINMAVVSNQVSMNYSLFSISFKQYTKVNFNVYLRNYRINQAKKLLETTDDKIKTIAAKVGFSNEKLFMKNFKLVTKMSASEYRKQLMYGQQ